jgi:hypothetical protein
VLPRAVASDLRAAMRGKMGAGRQAGAIMAGFALHGSRLGEYGKCPK